MSKKTTSILVAMLLFILLQRTLYAQIVTGNDDRFISYKVDTKKKDLKLFWKDDKQTPFKSILNLKTWLDRQHKTLLFAMNGGMYKQDNSPAGLYIENQKVLAR